MATDEEIGRAVADARDGQSQQAVADAMRERGWKWSQATVWAVESGNRALKLGEAGDLAMVLHVGVEDLLSTLSPDDRVAKTVGDVASKSWADLVAAIKKHASALALADKSLKARGVTPRVREQIEERLRYATLEHAILAADVDKQGISRVLDGIDQTAE